MFEDALLRAVQARDEVSDMLGSLWAVYIDDVTALNALVHDKNTQIDALLQQLNLTEEEVLNTMMMLGEALTVSKIMHRAWCGDEISEEEAEVVNGYFEHDPYASEGVEEREAESGPPAPFPRNMEIPF